MCTPWFCLLRLFRSASYQLFLAKMSQSKYFTRHKIATSAQLTHQQQGDGSSVGQEKKQASKRESKRQHVKVDYQNDYHEHAKKLKNEPSQIKTEPIDSVNCPSLKASPEAVQYVFKVKDEPKAKTMKWEPPLWQEQLANVFEMRKFRDAPVDSMGCDVIGDRSASPKVIVYRITERERECVCFHQVHDGVLLCYSGLHLIMWYQL